MAEFVQRRYEEMLPELEQLERIKIFDKREIREIAKKRKAFEYRLERLTKANKDYFQYIDYEMNILKLIKQRRGKFKITSNKSAIEHSIRRRINRLYRQATMRFKDDIRFWLAHIKFCKNANMESSIGNIINQMLQIHPDKPECWHMAAVWQKSENEEKEDRLVSRKYLLNGLKIHPDSQLLYTDLIRHELEESEKIEGGEKESEEDTSEENDDVPKSLKTVHVVYLHTLDTIKDVNFFIQVLKMVGGFKNTEGLQKIMLNDLLTHYGEEALTWDCMARRELEGPLPRPLKKRISACNEVYNEAIKRINTKEMWSLYIQCMLEITLTSYDLPNFTKKLLTTALVQGHQSRKLSEKHYLLWIKLLISDITDENVRNKVSEIFSWSTEALPESAELWNQRLKHLLSIDHEDAVEIFEKAKRILGSKSLPLWKTKLSFIKSQSPEKLEEFYEAALNSDPVIANFMKSKYIRWLVLTKGIQAARDVYDNLSKTIPFSMELHDTMISIELKQSKIDQHKLREVFEIAVLQFGNKSVNLWEQYINFESKYGKIENVGLLHKKALNTLEPSFAAEFTLKHSLDKANQETDEKREGLEMMET